MTLQFSSAQLDQLAESRLESHLKSFLLAGAADPEATRAELASPQGTAMLRQQVARARGHGLSAELDVARYVIAAWLLGPEFDTRLPAMAQVLGDSRWTAAQRAESVERTATALLAALHGAPTS